jgi:hypothetical protein
MKSVADSPTWEHVGTHVDPSFLLESRNMRFGLTLDGINPFRHNNTQHNTWHVLLLLYNLLPFLVTKNFFIQLCILILGKESPTNESIDVFMQPLVDELQLLWEGVPAQDFSNPFGHRQFTLHGILMWAIADYPGYCLISGLCIHGFKGCTVCGPETISRTAKTGNKLNGENNARGNKVIFGGARRWTPRHHPYRRNLYFNGKPKDQMKPVRMSATETIRCAEQLQQYIRNGGRRGGPDDPVHIHSVKRLSCLYQLEYWKVNNYSIQGLAPEVSSKSLECQIGCAYALKLLGICTGVSYCTIHGSNGF